MNEEGLVLLVDPEEVADETRFETLNEKKFVRGKTDQHQWYLLVNDACAAANMSIDEAMRAYLAVMLWRFTGRSKLFDELAAFDFYQHALGIAKIDSPSTQDVADISLQYVAFFPERSCARHQPRTLEYVANIGTGLYKELAKSSGSKDDCISRAYRSMAASFGKAVMVLRSACPGLGRVQGGLQGEVTGDILRFPSVPEMVELGQSLKAKLSQPLGRFNLMCFRPEDSFNSKSN